MKKTLVVSLTVSIALILTAVLAKFVLEGDYFQTLGKEYGTQNPVYTMRTFPEKLYSPDGQRAFGRWSGGLLGIVGKQMEDFTEFHKQWYVEGMN